MRYLLKLVLPATQRIFKLVHVFCDDAPLAQGVQLLSSYLITLNLRENKSNQVIWVPRTNKMSFLVFCKFGGVVEVDVANRFLHSVLYPLSDSVTLHCWGD